MVSNERKWNNVFKCLTWLQTSSEAIKLEGWLTHLDLWRSSEEGGTNQTLRTWGSRVSGVSPRHVGARVRGDLAALHYWWCPLAAAWINHAPPCPARRPPLILHAHPRCRKYKRVEQDASPLYRPSQSECYGESVTRLVKLSSNKITLSRWYTNAKHDIDTWKDVFSYLCYVANTDS